MGFITRLHTVSHGPGRWELTRRLAWYDRMREEALVAPAGYVTDYASVPRIPLVFALCGDTGHLAATLHDYLYDCRRHDYTRAEADAIFRRALEDADRDDLEDREYELLTRHLSPARSALCALWLDGLAYARSIRRWTMWLGVRVGGWMPWYYRRTLLGRRLPPRHCPTPQTYP